MASSPYETPQMLEPENEVVPDLYKNQPNFSNFKKREDKPFNLENSLNKKGDSALKFQPSNDILEELSISMNVRRKVEKDENQK